MATRRVISQREARRTAKELRELQEKYDKITSRYRSDFPGVCFWNINGSHLSTVQQIQTVRELGFGVAVRTEGNDKLKLYAVKP